MQAAYTSLSFLPSIHFHNSVPHPLFHKQEARGLLPASFLNKAFRVTAIKGKKKNEAFSFSCLGSLPWFLFSFYEVSSFCSTLFSRSFNVSYRAGQGQQLALVLLAWENLLDFVLKKGRYFDSPILLKDNFTKHRILDWWEVYFFLPTF